ncbi:MAG: Fic family protein [Thaumarchaeota archaeon]|nr:Fic family protein [Nitrososphaerota archaeon]MDE1873298.1 Fic family protein [Nitrososphaerota archaeon]
MTNLTKELVIEINRGIIQEWLEQNPTAFEAISANQDELKKILKIVDKQENLIMKASYLLGGISWAQPFSGGNKRTAFVCADTLLRLNGYRLSVDSEEEQEYLRKLLFEIQDERSKLNEETMAKIILYVSKRIRKI